MNQQERINKYLNQEMEAAESAHFEAEMATNTDLSESVDLQRDIGAFFKERAPALETILEAEGAQHFKEATSKNQFWQWKWLLPMLIIPLGLTFWWWQHRTDTLVPTQAESSTLEKSTIDDNSPFLMDTVPSVPPPSEEKVPNQSLDKQPNNTAKSTNKKELIASRNPADFQRNPAIESIMAEQVRATGSTTKLATPTKDATFSFAQNIPFEVSGTTTIAPPYTVSVYSNRVFDFENEYKALTASLSGTQQNENYHFSFKAKVPFPRGLYYILLQSEENEDILHISRFKVE